MTSERVDHFHHHDESIEVTRGQRGGYGWTVKAATVERILELDQHLQRVFAGGGASATIDDTTVKSRAKKPDDDLIF